MCVLLNTLWFDLTWIISSRWDFNVMPDSSNTLIRKWYIHGCRIYEYTHYTHTSKFFYTPLVGIHQTGYIYSEVVNINGINYLITAHRFLITAAVISAISCFIFRHTAANGMLLVSRTRNRKLTLCPSHLNNSMGQPD